MALGRDAPRDWSVPGRSAVLGGMCSVGALGMAGKENALLWFCPRIEIHSYSLLVKTSCLTEHVLENTSSIPFELCLKLVYVCSAG